ncbi:hypothetical protein JOM56_005431 [Amanita muscaria]
MVTVQCSRNSTTWIPVRTRLPVFLTLCDRTAQAWQTETSRLSFKSSVLAMLPSSHSAFNTISEGHGFSADSQHRYSAAPSRMSFRNMDVSARPAKFTTSISDCWDCICVSTEMGGASDDASWIGCGGILLLLPLAVICPRVGDSWWRKISEGDTGLSKNGRIKPAGLLPQSWIGNSSSLFLLPFAQ